MFKVNILGAGLSGLSAAITLAENKIPCRLISRLPSERAQSVLAEGGINAALDNMGENDSVDQHYEDTMNAGKNIADPQAVRGLTENAPETVYKLVRIGVPFQAEGGKLLQRHFGGQKKRRTCFVKSSTGKIIMTSLIDEARKYEASGLIERFSHHVFIDLDLEDVRKENSNKVSGDIQDRIEWPFFADAGKKLCSGIRVLDSYTGENIYFSGPVILALGGMNGLFPGMTTGTVGNSADAQAKLFSQGVVFGNLEMIQYHPTTIGIPEKRMLISEAARGEGGRLYVMRNGRKWYFMEEKYPEFGNLMPRDVVSREMYFVTHDETCGDQVFLDMTGLSSDTWKKRLSDLRDEIIYYMAIDPAKTPVPVEPGIHYFMGGIDVDADHRTNAEGLYASGECCCQYHGANRLGGNSMLGAVYGGHVAARHLADNVDTYRQIYGLPDAESAGIGGDDGSEKNTENACSVSEEDISSSHEIIEKVVSVLKKSMGIARDHGELERGLDELTEFLEDKNLSEPDVNRIQLAKALIMSADIRKESRGAQLRTDYPGLDPGLGTQTAAYFEEGNVNVFFKEKKK